MSQINTTKPAGRGCLFYGCISAIVLVLLVGLTGFFTVRYLANRMIDTYTSATPTQFETVVLSDSEKEDLKKRVTTFQESLGKTNAPAELTLTPAEINTALAENPKWKKFAENVRVDIEDDQVICRTSIPTDALAHLPFMSRLKGRFVNGDCKLTFSLNNGNPALKMVSAVVNGEPLPKEFLDSLEREASFQKMLNDPEFRRHLDQIDWVRLQSGRLEIGAGGTPEPE